MPEEPTAQPDSHASDKPEIAFDLDGVLCRPPLGVNLAISRRLNLPPVPNQFKYRDTEEIRRRQLRFGLESLKYRGRRPLPDAKEGLIAVSEHRRPVIVTARSWIGKEIIQAWLDRYGLADYIEAIVANNTNLVPGQHKLRTLLERGIREHVDDDGSIAYHLARNGVERVFLREWFFNRGLPYPSNVIKIRHIADIARELEKDPAA